MLRLEAAAPPAGAHLRRDPAVAAAGTRAAMVPSGQFLARGPAQAMARHNGPLVELSMKIAGMNLVNFSRPRRRQTP